MGLGPAWEVPVQLRGKTERLLALWGATDTPTPRQDSTRQCHPIGAGGRVCHPEWGVKPVFRLGSRTARVGGGGDRPMWAWAPKRAPPSPEPASAPCCGGPPGHPQGQGPPSQRPASPWRGPPPTHLAPASPEARLYPGTALGPWTWELTGVPVPHCSRPPSAPRRGPCPRGPESWHAGVPGSRACSVPGAARAGWSFHSH